MAIDSATATASLQPHVDEAAALIRTAVVLMCAALVPVALWMAMAPLSSAVVAQGYVKVDLNRRPVQHSEGGVVRAVLVRDGEHVVQGQTMLLLGDISVDADANRLDFRVLTERAGQARLEAEQNRLNTLTFGPAMLSAANRDRRVSEQLAKEQALFAARRDSINSQINLLGAQRKKIGEEIGALGAQINQAGEAIRLQRIDLETNRSLLKDGFISQSRITQLESAVADYGVKLEERRSELARAEQRAVDTELRMASVDNDFRQQASDQLKAGAARLSELEQDQRKSVDALARQSIFSPTSGVVIDLKYASVGAIVPARETIAEIVPDESKLVTEAHVKPEDIQRIHRGQAVDIRFTAFKYRTTRLVHGQLSHVSADRLIDKATNAPYYQVHIETDAASLKNLGELRLVAGMPAEIYILGEERTPLQYLLEPITQVLRKAGRER